MTATQAQACKVDKDILRRVEITVDKDNLRRVEID